MESPLPYKDTKHYGAPDFYFAINATFRFIEARLGEEGCWRYLRDLGTEYFQPVNELWRREGLPGVARYWREFFDHEPGALVDVIEKEANVAVVIRRCPALHHLRSAGRTITKNYCRHCYQLNHARAAAAGLAVRVAGGNGDCVYQYVRSEALQSPQDLTEIREVS